MKILILLFILFLTSCSKNTSSDSNIDIEWTKNGTLHKKTISKWKMATEENKLATCADFVARIKNSENHKYVSIADMKYDAINLKACIDQTVIGNNYSDHMLISELAVTCYVLLNYDER